MARLLLDIQANQPIKQKIAAIQSFLGDHYFHDNGIMYSNWFWKDDEQRPFQHDDFDTYAIPWNRKDYTPQGYWSGENSLMVSGIFLFAQALRYQVTGDEQAKRYAQKAFTSLEKIVALAEAKQQYGFLCKPYDWTATDETSPDQYICVMHGLWEYYKIADYKTQQTIRRWLPLMADWWRERDYILTYFGVTWPILPHHGPAMACLNSMAYKVSGDYRYRDECLRLLDIAGSWPTWIDRNRRELIHPTGFPIEKKGERWPKELHGFEYDPTRRPYLLNCFEVGEIWLTIVCAAYFMKEDAALSPLIKHAVSRHYKYMHFALRDDWLTLYRIQVDLERDIWKPIKPIDQDPKVADDVSSISFGEMCWQDHAARFPDTALIGHLHAPEFCPAAFVKAKKMLQLLDNRRLHWFVDPDGKQIGPKDFGIQYVLSSDVPVFSVLAYWRARAAGVEMDNYTEPS